MAWILHLSDFHLGRKRDPSIAAYPTAVLPPAARLDREKFLRVSLEQIAQSDMVDRLDCVVVTGDIIDKGNLPNLDGLNRVLDGLGDKAPAASRVVVVPGNHDIPQDRDSDHPTRYAEWCHVTRDKGYVTPLLDGV